MATQLHQQLKHHFVSDESRHEVTVDGYRIDAIDSNGRLIEVQCASLAAIRDKVRNLVQNHQVIVVKPLAARKKITRLHRRGGEVLSSRFSPVRESVAHLFQELVHFAVFPHPRLQLHLLLTEQEEIRVPPSARSSWRKKYSVAERSLTLVQEELRLRTAADLWRALKIRVPAEFTTADMVQTGELPRWLAQKAAWCFRRMNYFEVAGKQGNSIVYRIPTARKSRKPADRAA